MKIIKIEYLINKGDFANSPQMTSLLEEIKQAIHSVKHPANSEEFHIYPEQKGNGVKPIKESCMRFLQNEGWRLEVRMSLGSRINPGPIDAVKTVGTEMNFAVEWETGNISSSHRALNKLGIGLLDNKLIGGFLILPSRKLYFYLTDRIGNYAEIEPYFPIWKGLNVDKGVLGVIEVEHDCISEQVPKIPKGTDGRALV